MTGWRRIADYCPNLAESWLEKPCSGSGSIESNVACIPLLPATNSAGESIAETRGPGVQRDTHAADGKAVEPRSGLPVSAIRDQLGRILASPDFNATDKLRDFLRYIVDEKLAGRPNRLNAYTIALAVFGRGEDFDGTNDPIVRIQAGRLRRALDRYYLAAGSGDPILIDIPKGRYIPRFAALAAGADDPHARAVQQAGLRAARTGLPSVGVLPIEYLNGDNADVPLATGLTEELVTELARFQDIRVIACHRSHQPEGLLTDPVELGRRLGIRFALQCTIRSDASTEKVSAHLVDTADGAQIWASAFSYSPEASSLIATQEEIASQVVAAVASEYGIIARRLSSESRKKRPADLETYQAMLRYYDHQMTPSPQSAAACFPALMAAGEREPEYGPLWSALATLYCQAYTFDIAGIDAPLDTALEYARRGVFLEPGSQLGRLILAYASHLADDADNFHEESRIAMSLNPGSPYTVGSVGYLHALRGEIDVGIPLLDQAISFNPCHPAWFKGAYVVGHLLDGNYETALAETLTHRPFIDFWDDVMIAAILGHLDRVDEARPHVQRVEERKPEVATQAADLMRRSLKIDELVDDLVDGLKRAGLAV